MKKIISVIVSLMLVVALFSGCAASAPAATTAAATGAATEASVPEYKVAIVQQLDHSSLDEIRTSVAAELQARAYAAGVKIIISQYNGQNDPTMLGQIGAQVVGD